MNKNKLRPTRLTMLEDRIHKLFKLLTELKYKIRELKDRFR